MSKTILLFAARAEAEELGWKGDTHVSIFDVESRDNERETQMKRSRGETKINLKKRETNLIVS